jgi:hypothetical protein
VVKALLNSVQAVQIQGGAHIAEASQPERTPVQPHPTARFSTDARKSAQIPVTAVDLGGRIGHEPHLVAVCGKKSH